MSMVASETLPPNYKIIRTSLRTFKTKPNLPLALKSSGILSSLLRGPPPRSAAWSVEADGSSTYEGGACEYIAVSSKESRWGAAVYFAFPDILPND
jgi:hypothetical protein